MCELADSTVFLLCVLSAGFSVNIGDNKIQIYMYNTVWIQH